MGNTHKPLRVVLILNVLQVQGSAVLVEPRWTQLNLSVHLILLCRCESVCEFSHWNHHKTTTNRNCTYLVWGSLHTITDRGVQLALWLAVLMVSVLMPGTRNNCMQKPCWQINVFSVLQKGFGWSLIPNFSSSYTPWKSRICTAILHWEPLWWKLTNCCCLILLICKLWSLDLRLWSRQNFVSGRLYHICSTVLSLHWGECVGNPCTNTVIGL